MEKIKIGKLNSQKRHRANITDQRELDERRRTCMKALLNRPWIAKETEPQLYYWIKEEHSKIQNWFMTYTGYSVILNKKFAKLDKGPAIAFPWMGFQEFRTSMDYALFTYGIWFLENKADGEQFLLTELVKEIQEYMAQQGMIVSWKDYYHRLSMARALKKMKSLEIIDAVDGQEAVWANDEVNHDVLYQCRVYSHYVLRNFPKDLTNYNTIEELAGAQVAEAGSEANQGKRHHLYRRYLLEPVVMDNQWKNDLLYFHGQKNHMIRQIQTMFGWEGTVYKEGVLLFESEMTSDCEVFPTMSAISDICMLVCSKVRDDLTDPESQIRVEFDGSIHMTKSQIERILIQLKADYSSLWTNDLKKQGSDELANLVCEHLSEWGFGKWGNGLFVLSGVAGRWKVQYGTTELEE